MEEKMARNVHAVKNKINKAWKIRYSKTQTKNKVNHQQHKLNVALYKILHLNLHLSGLFKPVNVLNLLAHSDSIFFKCP